MKRNDLVAFLDRGKFAFDLVALGLKAVHRGSQSRWVDTVLYDGVARPPKLAVDFALSSFQFAARVDSIFCQPLARIIVSLDVFYKINRIGQFALQAGKCQMLEIIALDAAAVRALSALAEGRALHAVRPVPIPGRDHAAAATTTTKKPGEHAALLVRPRLCWRAILRLARLTLAGLRRLPKLIVNDPQVRRLSDPPLIRRVWARDALFRRRIFDHADFVPHDLPDINFVQEQAMAALQIAVNSRGVPASPSWRRNTGFVEIMRDVARRLCADILGENAPNDLCFCLHDLQLAAFAGNSAITVSAAASVPAVAQHAFHPAPGMNHKIFNEHLAHEGTQRSIQLADFSASCVDLDAEEIEPFA